MLSERLTSGHMKNWSHRMKAELIECGVIVGDSLNVKYVCERVQDVCM